MERQTIRIRRVGSVTFGMVLVVTGVLFLIHLFLPGLDLRVIFQFWPLMLITLGVEVLLEAGRKLMRLETKKGRL